MYKKPMLCSLLSQKGNQKSIVVIGVFGLHRYAGGTHLSILLAEYIRSFYGYSVELIENSDREDIAFIADKFHIKSYCTDKKSYFMFHRISFATQVAAENMGFLMNGDFEYYILDLGSDFRKAREELMRCDRKIIIGNFAPWNEDAWNMLNDLLMEVKNNESWHIISNLSLRLSKKQKQLQCKCYALGFEPNLFHPTKKAIRLFKNII